MHAAFRERRNYNATSNNMKLVHWPLMGGLLHLVGLQWGGDWAGPQLQCQSPYCCIMVSCSAVSMHHRNYYWKTDHSVVGSYVIIEINSVVILGPYVFLLLFLYGQFNTHWASWNITHFAGFSLFCWNLSLTEITVSDCCCSFLVMDACKQGQGDTWPLENVKGRFASNTAFSHKTVATRCV